MTSALLGAGRRLRFAGFVEHSVPIDSGISFGSTPIFEYQQLSKKNFRKCCLSKSSEAVMGHSARALNNNVRMVVRECG